MSENLMPMSENNIIRFIEEIRDYCLIIGDCENCMFSSCSCCKLHGYPYEWGVNDIKEQNREANNENK